VDHGLAELIGWIPDVGKHSEMDSQEFGDSLGMYWFGDVLPGHYYIRATLLTSSAYYGQYVPTYYIDAVNWSNATMIELGPAETTRTIFHMHNMSQAILRKRYITEPLPRTGNTMERSTGCNIE